MEAHGLGKNGKIITPLSDTEEGKTVVTTSGHA